MPLPEPIEVVESVVGVADAGRAASHRHAVHRLLARSGLSAEEADRQDPPTYPS